MIFHSPAEPAKMVTALKKAAHEAGIEQVIPASFVETKGCDFCWLHDDKWYGVQRKEVKDFIASVMDDDRLSREIPQMQQSVALPVLIIEGPQRFTNDDHLMMDSMYMRTITRKQWHGMRYSMMLEGIHVLDTQNQDETAARVCELFMWSRKDHHHSLRSRGGPPRNSEWGDITNRDYGVHLLQGLPGVGYELAGRIFDQFDGVPFRWTVEEAELAKIKGIGKVKARKIYQSLRGNSDGG